MRPNQLVNLRARMNELMPDEILALEPGGRALERQRHEDFDVFRSAPRSEYFFPGGALQRHIARVRSTHGAPPIGLPTLRGASRAWEAEFEASVEI